MAPTLFKVHTHTHTHTYTHMCVHIYTFICIYRTHEIEIHTNVKQLSLSSGAYTQL